jgi:regulatory protein
MDYSITERGITNGVLTVQLEGGSSFFIAKDIWETLREPPQTTEELEFMAAQTGARKKALDLLASRSHSRGELRLKLLKREFDPQAVELALEWINYKGYLNDEEFAHRWVKERLRKHPEGPMALEGGLRARGISSQLIKKVLGELSEDDRRDALLQARKKLMNRHSEPVKLRAALMRRGFGAADFRLLEKD